MPEKSPVRPMTRAEKIAAGSLVGAIAAALIIPTIGHSVQEQQPKDRIIDALEEHAGLTVYDDVAITRDEDGTYDVVLRRQSPPAFMNIPAGPDLEYSADLSGWWDQDDSKYIHVYPVVGETALTPINDPAIASWTAEPTS